MNILMAFDHVLMNKLGDTVSLITRQATLAPAAVSLRNELIPQLWSATPLLGLSHTRTCQQLINEWNRCRA